MAESEPSSEERVDASPNETPDTASEKHDLARIESTKPAFSLPHEIAFVALMCSAQLMTQAGLGQVIAPLHFIGDSFGITNPGVLSWSAAAYSLTVGTFILIAGRLGDMYGHRPIFILGWLWFGLWSLFAGVSVYSNETLFFFCRALQGIGPAFLLPSSLAIMGSVYPAGKRKNMVFSLFGAVAPTGFLIGAIFASLFAQLAWWPWAFWSFAIACCVLSVLSYLIIPPNPDRKQDKDQTTFDYIGALTGIASLVLINFAWNQGPTVGWTSPYVYSLLIVGFLVGGVFVFTERRVARPLVPLSAFSGNTLFVLSCIAAGWSSFGIWVYYVWQLQEVLRGDSPLLATAHIIPTSFSGVIAAITTGFLMGRIRTAWIMLIAMLAFCIGAILVATVPVHQVYWAQFFVSFIVTPWGMDMSFPAATVLLSNSVPKEHQGIAASLVSTIVNYSISIGLGIAGTVDSQVNKGGQDVLAGYRGAQYTEIGLSGLGVLIASVFLIKTYVRPEVGNP
ncbi:MAG: hypothetical protein M4579_002404 [Chaenotheca gracillima]|nr:MAG: hypothetical protein M4579_002404 [Chaenotheca gracillima]